MMIFNVGFMYFNEYFLEGVVDFVVCVKVNGVIVKIFFLEFINRIDDIILYWLLSRVDIRKVVDVRLKEI